MSTKYSTSEIAKQLNIHPNTVRFYEDIEFLPKIPRKQNGYRAYSQIHLEQMKLIRIGLKSELLQNGLRKQIIEIIKTSAKGEYDKALELAKQHLISIEKEEKNAEDAIGNEISEFSSKLDIDLIYKYATAVYEKTNKMLLSLSFDDLKRKYTNSDKEIIKSLRVVDEKEEWLLDYWCSKNLLGLICMPFSRHLIMHLEASIRIKNKIKNKKHA